MLRKLSGIDPVLVVMTGAVVLALTCSLILRTVVGPMPARADEPRASSATLEPAAVAAHAH